MEVARLQPVAPGIDNDRVAVVFFFFFFFAL